MKNLMTGFDIGEGTVKMLQAAGKEIKKSAVIELPDNIVDEGKIISMDAMADFIRQKSKEKGFARGEAAVILPAGLAFVKTITMPMMNRQQLMFNLPFEFKDYLTAGKDKYLFDYTVLEVINDEAGKPYEMRIFACAIQRATIESYRRMFARAGYKLKLAIPAECAYMSILHENGKLADKDICVLDLGHHTTCLHIFQRGEYAAKREISMGMAALDEIISEREGVDIHMARAYKESNYNGVLSCKEAKELYANLAFEITKAVNFFNYNNENAELHEIYLSGGGAAIAPLAETIGAERNLHFHSARELAPKLEGIEKAHAILKSYGAVAAWKDAEKNERKAKEKPGIKGINMVSCGLPKKTARVVSIGMALILLLVVFVVKVGVIDQFTRLSAAESAYSAVHEQNTALDEKLKGYDEVAIQYRAYSKSFIESDGEDGGNTVQVDRQEILDLIEQKMASRGSVCRVSINGNTAVIAMEGMNLKEISKMNDELRKSAIVRDVTLNIARTDSENSAKAMSFTVTLDLQAEEEKQ